MEWTKAKNKMNKNSRNLPKYFQPNSNQTAKNWKENEPDEKVIWKNNSERVEKCSSTEIKKQIEK